MYNSANIADGKKRKQISWKRNRHKIWIEHCSFKILKVNVNETCNFFPLTVEGKLRSFISQLVIDFKFYVQTCVISLGFFYGGMEDLLILMWIKLYYN